jgi:hypothetical protein
MDCKTFTRTAAQRAGMAVLASLVGGTFPRRGGCVGCGSVDGVHKNAIEYQVHGAFEH